MVSHLEEKRLKLEAIEREAHLVRQKFVERFLCSPVEPDGWRAALMTERNRPATRGVPYPKRLDSLGNPDMYDHGRDRTYTTWALFAAFMIEGLAFQAVVARFEEAEGIVLRRLRHGAELYDLMLNRQARHALARVEAAAE